MAPYSCFDNIIRCRLCADSSGPPVGPGPPPIYCCNRNRADLKSFFYQLNVVSCGESSGCAGDGRMRGPKAQEMGSRSRANQ
jgi:hypothetical protein